MNRSNSSLIALVLLLSPASMPAVSAAETVPPAIELPGTQPLEAGTLESPNKCDNCHGGYDPAVEPTYNWHGSMMSAATRDPLFWATMAIAEQDFDGAGDFCLRCHTTTGWMAGRSTPTDGSALLTTDAEGIDCDFCHKMTDPDNSEHLGVMNEPFVANEASDDGYDWDDPDGSEGYLGSGMVSLWAGAAKLGPYDDADARHQFMQSGFHRDRDFCGTCHEVSNPAVGELAPNHGAQIPANVTTGSGSPGDTVAFNNPPYRYGVVERTFSEYKAGQLARTRVNDYASLPDDLQDGAIEAAWAAATASGTRSGDYTHPDAPRYFSCQTCHMSPVTGRGANKAGVPLRHDLPLHDMTGGNYWMAEVIEYLDSLGRLRAGGVLSTGQKEALEAGAGRAKGQLKMAAALSLNAARTSVRITNLTGHKLISGYPEGRRMWLNIQWRDAAGELLREDGAYGEIRDAAGAPVIVNGKAVRSLIDPDDDNTHVFEAHMGVTRDWAQMLTHLDPGTVLKHDRTRNDPGDPAHTTLGEFLASEGEDTIDTFHFVLNNVVTHDNRIPTWRMSRDIAVDRNILPVPAEQYGNPGAGGQFNHFAEIALDPPSGAASAEIRLMYQPTSWEYIQFLWLANDGSNAFLANEGAYMLDAWLNAGADDGLAMAEPFEMASIDWTAPAGNSVFVPVQPCRIVDTRLVGGVLGGGATRDYRARGDGLDTLQGGAFDCGIPGVTTAVQLNFTAVGPGGSGYLRAWPYDSTEPVATLMAYNKGVSISNSVAVPICNTCASDFTVKLYGGTTHLVVEVVGYYQSPPS